MQLNDLFLKVRSQFSTASGLRALFIYIAAGWIAFALLGYGMALRDFSRLSPSILTQGNIRAQGNVSGLHTYGFGSFKHYRFSINGSPELDLPAAIAYPLATGNPRPNRSMSDLLHEGKFASATTSGGPPFTVLELDSETTPGTNERLINFQESSERFKAAQAGAGTQATIFELLGLAVIPLAVGLRRRLIRR